MTETNLAVQETDAAEVQEGATELPENDNATQPDNSIEDKARKMGWISEEEYKGPKGKWVDAETFYNKGLEELPIMRDRYKKLDQNNDRLVKELSDLKLTLNDLKEHNSRVEKNTYERAMKEMQAQQEEAVESGDTQKFREIEQEKEKIRKNIEAVEAKKAAEPSQQPIEPEVLAWAEKEPWFMKDEELTAAATSYHHGLNTSQPGLPLRENLEKVSEHMRIIYPHKFGINPKRSMPSAVEGGGAKSSKKKDKGYNSLPPEAKAACDRLVKSGDITKEEYLKHYEWD